MNYYVAEWVEQTDETGLVFRPPMDEAGGWSVIDLRPDASVVDGYCLIASDFVHPAHPGLWFVTDELDATLSPPQLNFIGNKLGITLAAPTLRGAIAEIMLLHGTEDGSKWRPLKARRGINEILLRGLVFSAPVIVGAVYTESFNKADSDTLGPDLSWTEQDGDIDVENNEARLAALGSAGLSYARADSDTDGDDQYGEFSVEEVYDPTSGQSQFGVNLRASSTSAIDSYMWFSQMATTGDGYKLRKTVAGARSDLTSFTGEDLPTRPFLMRFEIEGSSLIGYWGATQKDSVTDTTFSGSSNRRAGMYMYSATGTTSPYISVDDFEFGDWASGLDIVKVQSETEGVTESALKTNSGLKVMSDSMGVTESDLPVRDVIRIQQETEGIVDDDIVVRDLVVGEPPLPFLDQFVAATSVPWSASKWVNEDVVGDTDVTMQGGYGYQEVGTVSTTGNARERTVGINARDVEFEAVFRYNVGYGNFFLSLRAASGYNPFFASWAQYGYVFYMNSAGWYLYESDPTVEEPTAIDSGSPTYLANNWYRLKVRVFDVNPTRLQGKMWNAASAEPADWNLFDTTDSVDYETAGDVVVSHQGGNFANDEIIYDWVRITDLSTLKPVGITENDLHTIGITVIQDETGVGLTEQDLRAIGLSTVETENPVGVTESAIQVRDRVKVDDDPVAVTEDPQRVLGLVVVETE
jgi:hypothetical protein